MPPSVRLTSRRSAISTEVSHRSVHCRRPRNETGREIELRLANGVSLITANGFASPEAGDAYTRAPGSLREAGRYSSSVGRALRVVELCPDIGLRRGPRPVAEDAGVDAGPRRHRAAAAGTSRRLDDSCFPGEPRAARSARRDAGSMISKSIASHAYRSMAGTIPASAHGTSEALGQWLIGYPEKALGKRHRRFWRWRSGSATRSPSVSHSFIRPVFTPIAARAEQALQRVRAARSWQLNSGLVSHRTWHVLRGMALVAQGAVERGGRSDPRGAE